MFSHTKMYSCAKCASINVARNGKKRVGAIRLQIKDCSYCKVLETQMASESLKE